MTKQWHEFTLLIDTYMQRFVCGSSVNKEVINAIVCQNEKTRNLYVSKLKPGNIKLLPLRTISPKEQKVIQCAVI